MTRVSAGIRITPKTNELKGKAKSLGNAVLNDRGFSNARRAHKQQRGTTAIWLGNLGRNILKNLELRVLLTIDSLIERLLGPLHKGGTGLRAILHLHRNLLVLAKGNRHRLIQPIPQLEVLPRTRIQALKRVVLGQDQGLNIGIQLEHENTEHEIDPRIRNRGPFFQRLQEFLLLLRL